MIFLSWYAFFLYLKKVKKTKTIQRRKKEKKKESEKIYAFHKDYTVNDLRWFAKFFMQENSSWTILYG